MRTIKGGVALAVRHGIAWGLNILGSVFVARILSAEEFGFYSIAIFIQTFLIVFGDVGVGASLIRQPETPEEDDYKIVFTVQLLLSFILSLVFLSLAFWLPAWYKVSSTYFYFFCLLPIPAVITTFQSIPSVKLLRNLEFEKLAIVEMFQAVIYNVVVVASAYCQLGAYSFILGLISRALSGAILINLRYPWNVGLHWDFKKLKMLLNFGLAYQGSSVVSLIKDSIMPLFIGLLLGINMLGLVNWALMIAAYPSLVLSLFQRLYFPVFSRIQNDKVGLQIFAEHIIKITNSVCSIFSILIVVYITPVTVIIFNDRWSEAIPLFYVLWFANLFIPTINPLYGLLNAVGKSKVTLIFSIIWMISTWLFGVPLISRFGILGFGWANFLVQLTNILLILIVKKIIPIRLKVIAFPWVWAAFLGLISIFIQMYLPVNNLLGLALHCLLIAMIYFIGLFAQNPGDIKQFFNFLKKREFI